jgi:phage terminase large subunit GpA-like protein
MIKPWANNNDNEFLHNCIASLTDEKLLLKVSEWAERTRYMPPELTAMPGPWENFRFPYNVEIMDCFSDISPIREVAFMKGAQIGATTGILENIIGYVIDHSPAPMMFVSADKTLVEQAVEVRVNRMLESSNLSHKIQSQSSSGSATGNTKSKKEFPGGFLLAVGAINPTKLRSFTIKILLMDEVDGYKLEAGEEGDPISLAKKRTNTFEQSRKILYISTPHLKGVSKIEALYLRGDQRKYFVPCKHCGEMQTLEFNSAKGGKLIYDLDNFGNLIEDSVHYVCPHCGGLWKNSDKAWFLQRGEWRATATSSDPTFRSYHLSGLYSPPSTYSWSSVVRDFLEAIKSNDRMKTFVNTVLGESYEETGESILYTTIFKNKIDYLAGTIPDPVKFLTIGADLHKDRIDLEVVGWADNYVSYSIDWRSFRGDALRPDSQVWLDFDNYVAELNQIKKVRAVMIDSGYSANTVYSFCVGYKSGMYPIKGTAPPKNGIVKSPYYKRDIDNYGGLVGVNAIVDIYKDRLHGFLHLEIKDKVVPHGYCFYPQDYPDEFFKQYSSEKKFMKLNSKGQVIGYEWAKATQHVDNHALDCRVYNYVALDFLIDAMREKYNNPELTVEQFFTLIENEH